jgi:periplasmic mercuric ion binding protein
MKRKLSLIVLTLMLTGTISVFAGNITKKFKVYGNCGMCENRIETAAKLVEGVTSADWDKETKMLEVTFNDAKTDVQKVQLAIAKAGHDTDMHRATDEAYGKLPACCKYERCKTITKDEKTE